MLIINIYVVGLRNQNTTPPNAFLFTNVLKIGININKTQACTDIPSNVVNDFKFTPVQPHEVVKVINKLKSNSIGSGQDNQNDFIHYYKIVLLQFLFSPFLETQHYCPNLKSSSSNALKEQQIL